MDLLNRAFITKLIANKEALIFCVQEGIDERWVAEEVREAYKWLLDFYKEYGESPSFESFSQKFESFSFYELEDPIEFITDSLNYERKKREGKKAILLAANHIETDPDQAFKHLEEGINSVVLKSPKHEVEVVSTIPSRREAYEAKKGLQGIEGIPSGFEPLDRYTRGWQAEDVITITARMGTGKTWCLLLMLNVAWKAGYSPLLITKEMSISALSARWDVVNAQVPYMGYRAGELTKLEEAKLYEMWTSREIDKDSLPPFIISGEESMEGGGVSSVRALIDKHKPDIVGIDGLYLLTDEHRASSGWEQLTNITRDLKKLAKVIGIPILGTTQASRKSSSVTGPALETISYSDSVGQDSDIILALHQTEEMREDKIMKIRVLKSRESETTQFFIKWDLNTMQFTPLENVFMEEAEEDDFVYENKIFL